MTDKAPVAVAIITKDEEANLSACLQSVAFAAQIVVVDSGSADATLRIARDFGCDVFEEPWRGGFGAQKQFAIDQCHQPWILVLDADERIPEATAAMIRSVTAVSVEEAFAQTAAPLPRGAAAGRVGGGSGPVVFETAAIKKSTSVAPGEAGGHFPSLSVGSSGSHGPGPDLIISEATVGYSFPRKNFFQGRWIRHAGWWPDRLTRLFRRGRGGMSAAPVHEGVEVNGPVEDLDVPIEHFTESDLGKILQKIDRYSTLGAEEAYAKGKRATVSGAMSRAGLTFFQDYVLRLGILDGSPGLTLAVTDAVNKFFKYAKLAEMSRKNRKQETGNRE